MSEVFWGVCMEQSEKLETSRAVSELRGFGWTLERIASEVGASKSTVSDWQCGATPRPAARVKLLALHSRELLRIRPKDDALTQVYEKEFRRMTASFPAASALEAYHRLEAELDRYSPNILHRFSSAWQQQQLHLLLGNYSESRRLVAEFPKFGRDSLIDRVLLSIGDSATAQVDFYLGRPLEELRFELEKSELPDGSGVILPNDLGGFSIHAEILRLSHLSIVLTLLGFPTEALYRMRQAIKLAEDTQEAAFLIAARAWAADLDYIEERPESALRHASRALNSPRNELPLGAAIAEIHRGYCISALNRDKSGPQSISEAIETLEKNNFEFAKSFWLEILAKAHLSLGNRSAGLETIERGLEFARNRGETFWIPALQITRAGLLMLSPNASIEEPLSYLDDAIDWASGTSCRLMRGRAEIMRRRILNGTSASSSV